jgi:hypothetical protein
MTGLPGAAAPTRRERLSAGGRRLVARLLGPTWPRWGEWVALALAFAAIFFVRLEILLQYPYPPSGDVAGDLYAAEAWWGHPIPALASQPLPPPIYFFAIVTPFTSLFPVFLGMQLYMVFVPALVVFPAYFWLRESAVRPLLALFGAGLLAMAAAFSLMLTWNAAYNLFGIVFLILFLAFLARAFRRPGRTDLFLAGVSFALIAGTHQLTFVVGAIAFATFAMILLATSAHRWRDLRRLLLIAAIGFALAAPFLALDALSAQATANVGLGNYRSNVTWAYGNALYFGWGFQAATPVFLASADVALAVVGLLNLLRHGRLVPFWATTYGILVGALAVPLLDAGNAIRGLYFLPIPFVAGLPRLLEDTATWPDWRRPWRRPRPGVAAVPVRRARRAMLAPGLLVGAVAASLLLTNAAFSLQLMDQSARFYQSLTPNDVAVLDWIARSTPANATVYDDVGFPTWIWAYDHRMAYAPQQLALQVTQQSYQAALASNLVQSGTYVTSDDVYLVGTNFPGQVGLPEIYLRSSGAWYPLLGTEGDTVHFLVAQGPRNYTLSLGSADLVYARSSANTSSVVSTFGLWYAPIRVGMQESLSLTGGRAVLAWSSNTSRLLAVEAQFGMPPSGYSFGYSSVPTVTNGTAVADVIGDGVDQGTLDYRATNLSQSVGPNGWVTVSFRGGATLVVNESGLPPQAGIAPFALETSRLLRSLSVSYVLVGPNGDYPVYLRFAAGGPPALAVDRVAEIGGVDVFRVAYPAVPDPFTAGSLPPDLP